MKKLISWIACYASLFLIIFGCEDATEADMFPKISSTNDYHTTKPSQDQTIWFTFNKANLPEGKYKVGTNPSTGSQLFIVLKKNEVVEVHIQTIGGFVIEFDPIDTPHGKNGLGPAEFICVNPNVIKIFESHSDTIQPASKLPKYTIYVVPKGCDPRSHVLLISIGQYY